ncbi:MAG: dTDP-4-dehydrorhamnose reductase [Bacteroidales bacterium]|jgi:dTDP-4-dehydrorhamnose reductase|nr:dTDP-4-dehydrorhamnose reductase [Bacteroidales bacterium]
MRIIVFGSNGQLGKSFQAIAQQFEHDFLFADIADVDFTNEDLLRQFLQNNPADLIINCAAYTAVDKAEEEQELCMAINGIAPGIIAEFCKKNNTKLIHYSTDYVFDGNSNEEYVESDDTNPCNFYGISKLKGEDNIIKYNPDGFIIRISGLISVYGNNFITTINRLMKTRDEVSVVKNQITKLTSATDLANESMKLIKRISKGIDILHYANDPAASWYNFAKIVKEKTDSSCKLFAVTEYPQIAVRPKRSILNCSKIELLYGISMKSINKEIDRILNVGE